MRKAFGNLDAVKCSLLLEHRLDYSSCTTVALPDNTGGTKDPAATWRTECPSEHFISALYNDNKFAGVKKIKCCPSRGKKTGSGCLCGEGGRRGNGSQDGYQAKETID